MTKSRGVDFGLGVLAVVLTVMSYALTTAGNVAATTLTCKGMNCKPDSQKCNDGTIQPGCWATCSNNGGYMICDFNPE